jgi:hypothetical protein
MATGMPADNAASVGLSGFQQLPQLSLRRQCEHRVRVGVALVGQHPVIAAGGQARDFEFARVL